MGTSSIGRRFLSLRFWGLARTLKSLILLASTLVNCRLSPRQFEFHQTSQPPPLFFVLPCVYQSTANTARAVTINISTAPQHIVNSATPKPPMVHPSRFIDSLTRLAMAGGTDQPSGRSDLAFMRETQNHVTIRWEMWGNDRVGKRRQRAGWNGFRKLIRITLFDNTSGSVLKQRLNIARFSEIEIGNLVSHPHNMVILFSDSHRSTGHVFTYEYKFTVHFL